MPKYQCHKQVWALKIKAIGEGSSNSEFAILKFEDAGYGPLPVSAEWHFKHKPEVGGYYVAYEDGYKSYSPAAAFESGYTSVDSVLTNPHTGTPRDSRDVASDTQATLCVKPGEPLKAAPIALPVIDPGPDFLEREIQAKASNGPRVTPADIEAEIASEHYFTAREGVLGGLALDGVPPSIYEKANAAPQSLGLLTFCVLVLQNGFTVTGESACASPENFNAEIGRRIARENAVSKVWPLLGFRLRDKLASVQNNQASAP